MKRRPPLGMPLTLMRRENVLGHSFDLDELIESSISMSKSQ
ncbi:hypothetical protein [Paenibacillus lutimineralis]|nr:hypothetical protein [Paenibacillus lutimineralis]